MDTWTRQPGFPMVSAVRNGTTLTLKQNRFLLDSKAEYSPESSPAHGYKWEIPITYITSNNNTVHTCWLTKDQDLVTIEIPDVSWIKLNYRQVGYYMVNYSENDWSLLSSLLQNNIDALSAADRSNLIHDAFSLAEASHLPYSIAMNMTKYLVSEQHYVPWAVAAPKIIDLRQKLFHRKGHQNIEKYVQYLLGSVKEDFWNDSGNISFLHRKLQKVLLNLGCLCDSPNCQTKVYELFKQFLYENIKPNSDIQYLVYYYGMAQGNVNDWEKLWDLYLIEQEHMEKTKFLVALTASKDPQLLTRLIQYAKNESYIQSHNYLETILQISKNPIGTQLVWDSIRDDWQYLVNRFSYDRTCENLISSLSYSFNTHQRLEELKAFYTKYPEDGAAKGGRNSTLEVVSNNIEWLEKHEANIDSWLINYN